MRCHSPDRRDHEISTSVDDGSEHKLTTGPTRFRGEEGEEEVEAEVEAEEAEEAEDSSLTAQPNPQQLHLAAQKHRPQVIHHIPAYAS